MLTRRLFLAALLASPSARAKAAPRSRIAAPPASFLNSVGFVEGRIGASGPYWFLVDTGASRSALDRALAAELGLAAARGGRVEGSAGTIETEAVRVPALGIGTLTMHNLAPTVYDLSATPAPPGRRFAGIIGHDAFGSQAVLFDPRGGRVAFARRAEAFGPLAGAAIVAFRLDNGIPRVAAAIDDLPVELRLDTGAAIGPGPTIFLNVTQAFYDRLRAADPSLVPARYFTATGTGGEIRIPVVRAHRLVLGAMTIPDPQLIVQQPVGYFARPDAVGFIASYTLQSRSRFIVDYPGSRLILFP